MDLPGSFVPWGGSSGGGGTAELGGDPEGEETTEDHEFCAAYAFFDPDEDDPELDPRQFERLPPANLLE